MTEDFYRKIFEGKTFLCFSPAVMAATFFVELLLGVVVFVRYRFSTASRLIILIVSLLAVFQAAEYIVCIYPHLAFPWSQIGFVAITLLPILGLDLIRLQSGKSFKFSLRHIIGGIFSSIFIFLPASIAHVSCKETYAVFHLLYPLDIIYFAYYFLFLLWGLRVIVGELTNKKTTLNSQGRQSLVLIGVGYLSFMIPMGVLSLLLRNTLDGIPSIMCGFAIFFAFILVFGIAPRLKNKKS